MASFLDADLGGSESEDDNFNPVPDRVSDNGSDAGSNNGENDRPAARSRIERSDADDEDADQATNEPRRRRSVVNGDEEDGEDVEGENNGDVRNRDDDDDEEEDEDEEDEDDDEAVVRLALDLTCLDTVLTSDRDAHENELVETAEISSLMSKPKSTRTKMRQTKTTRTCSQTALSQIRTQMILQQSRKRTEMIGGTGNWIDSASLRPVWMQKNKRKRSKSDMVAIGLPLQIPLSCLEICLLPVSTIPGCSESGAKPARRRRSFLLLRSAWRKDL